MRETGFRNQAFGTENDFRASGSGHILYAREEIDERCVRIAFDVNRKSGASLACFVFCTEIILWWLS